MSKDPSENKACSAIFTTEPNTRRHLYGLTATRKRAALLMELLFQNGFVLPSPYYVVKEFLVKKAEFIGLDPRTIAAYIGRPEVIFREDQLPKTDLTITYKKSQAKVFKEYLAVRTLREKLGFCQQLGYMSFEYRGSDEKSPKRFKKHFVIFNHKEVPLPYHLEQKPLFNSEKSETVAPEIGRMGTSKSEVCVEASKDDLCVLPIAVEEVHEEVVTTQSRERRVSKQHTQICSNLESESIPHRVIVIEGDGLSPSQRAEIEERDRKRLEILDRDLVQQLEKSVKK
jgi:hypothetical protein